MTVFFHSVSSRCAVNNQSDPVLRYDHAFQKQLMECDTASLPSPQRRESQTARHLCRSVESVISHKGSIYNTATTFGEQG